MKILVGYRRLYEALGCPISSEEVIQHQFSFSENFMGLLYFGPAPNFGVFSHSSSERFILPGQPNDIGKIKYRKDVNDSEFAGKSFFEVAVLSEFDVDSGQCESVVNGDIQTRDELLDLCEQNTRTFLNLHSIVAGAIGLKIHRQFVMNPLNENQVLLIDGKSFFRFHTKTFESLDPIRINKTGEAIIANLVTIFDKIPLDALEEAGEILSWLQRAWAETDPITKFIACFIPIECILAPIRIPMPDHEKEALKKIATLIDKTDKSERDKLQAVFTKYRQPRFPSLEDRFEILANEVGFPTAKKDIEAFKRFNKIRNDLHHRGDASANIIIDLDSSTIHSLEDIAERYVNFAIFADRGIYKSSWRPSL